VRRPPALATSPEDAGAAVRAAILMSETAPALSKRAAALKSQIDEFNSLTEQTKKERLTLANEEAALSARREEIAALASEKRLSSVSLATETKSLRAETERLGREAETLRDLLEGLAKAAPATPGLKPPVRPPAAPAIASVARPRDLPVAPPALATRPCRRSPGCRRRPAAQVGERDKRGAAEGITLRRDQAQVIAPMDAKVNMPGVPDLWPDGDPDVGGGVLVIVSGWTGFIRRVSGFWLGTHRPHGGPEVALSRTLFGGTAQWTAIDLKMARSRLRDAAILAARRIGRLNPVQMQASGPRRDVYRGAAQHAGG
jgi:hypothetical protein